MKIQKKNWGAGRGVRGLGRGGGGVRVDEELKFLGKFTKKTFGGCREGVRWGSGWWGGGWSGWMCTKN